MQAISVRVLIYTFAIDHSAWMIQDICSAPYEKNGKTIDGL